MKKGIMEALFADESMSHHIKKPSPQSLM